MLFLHCPRKFTFSLWRIGNRTLTVMTVATEFHRTSPTFCNFLQLTSNIYFLYYNSFKNKNQSIYYCLPEFFDLYSLIIVEINPSVFSGYFSWIHNVVALGFWWFFTQFFVAGLDSPYYFENALIPYKTWLFQHFSSAFYCYLNATHYHRKSYYF